MLTATELDEYLTEIRSQVCTNCEERPDGGPPCGPQGKLCGVEENLAELVDAIHGVLSDSVGPYFETKQRQVCEHCWFRRSDFCPCPMDYLLVLVIEAVETVDARHERREKGRRRLRGGTEGADVQEIRRLYDEATGVWTGCDWSTRIGTRALDLNGWTAAAAHKKGDDSKIETVAADWHAAGEWLAKIERLAERAEEHAKRAMQAVTTGAWHEALEQARLAWSNEFATSRMVWRGFPMTWHRFFLAVESAVPMHPNATPADLAICSAPNRSDHARTR